MRYGLCLLVCFAMTVGANAAAPKVCTGDKCSRVEGVVVNTVKGVVHVATAPVRAVAGCSAPAVSSAPQQKTGPIRELFRNVFGRR